MIQVLNINGLAYLRFIGFSAKYYTIDRFERVKGLTLYDSDYSVVENNRIFEEIDLTKFNHISSLRIQYIEEIFEIPNNLPLSSLWLISLCNLTSFRFSYFPYLYSLTLYDIPLDNLKIERTSNLITLNLGGINQAHISIGKLKGLKELYLLDCTIHTLDLRYSRNLVTLNINNVESDNFLIKNLPYLEKIVVRLRDGQIPYRLSWASNAKIFDIYTTGKQIIDLHKNKYLEKLNLDVNLFEPKNFDEILTMPNISSNADISIQQGTIPEGNEIGIFSEYHLMDLAYNNEVSKEITSSLTELYFYGVVEQSSTPNIVTRKFSFGHIDGLGPNSIEFNSIDTEILNLHDFKLEKLEIKDVDNLRQIQIKNTSVKKIALSNLPNLEFIHLYDVKSDHISIEKIRSKRIEIISSEIHLISTMNIEIGKLVLNNINNMIIYNNDWVINFYIEWVNVDIDTVLLFQYQGRSYGNITTERITWNYYNEIEDNPMLSDKDIQSWIIPLFKRIIQTHQGSIESRLYSAIKLDSMNMISNEEISNAILSIKHPIINHSCREIQEDALAEEFTYDKYRQDLGIFRLLNILTESEKIGLLQKPKIDQSIQRLILCQLSDNKIEEIVVNKIINLKQFEYNFGSFVSNPCTLINIILQITNDEICDIIDFQFYYYFEGDTLNCHEKVLKASIKLAGILDHCSNAALKIERSKDIVMYYNHTKDKEFLSCKLEKVTDYKFLYEMVDNLDYFDDLRDQILFKLFKYEELTGN